MFTVDVTEALQAYSDWLAQCDALIVELHSRLTRIADYARSRAGTCAACTHIECIASDVLLSDCLLWLDSQSGQSGNH